MPTILGNRKYRNAFLQALFLGTIMAFGAMAIVMTRRNLDTQGVTVGWDFLDYATGWTIQFSLLPYDINSPYKRALLVGLCNTLLLGGLTLVLASIIGGAVGTARLSSHKLVSKIVLAYVQFFRNIPLILQAFFWYTLFTHLPNARNAYSLGDVVFFSNRGFFVPALNVNATSVLIAIGAVVVILAGFWLVRKRAAAHGAGRYSRIVEAAVVIAVVLAIIWSGRAPDRAILDFPVRQGLRFVGGLELPPEFCAAVVSISLFGASYIAEIVRSGLLAVSRGKIEAGLALGLKPGQIFWRIRLPLAIRIILPTLTNQYVWLIKATSIGIAIGFSDFFMVVANSINHSGQTLSLILVLVLGFWAINFSLTAVLNAVNRSIALRGQNVR